VPRLRLPGLRRYCTKVQYSAISIDRLVLVRAPKKSKSESDTCERALLWQVGLKWHGVDCENFVEQLITTVIVVLFDFVLDVSDTATHQTRVPAYYEVEKSNHITEVRPLPHHHHNLHSIEKGHLTGKRVSHGLPVSISPMPKDREVA
jgi:hypothetical protein